MKAVILVGGLGKRLRKVVRDKPKSMAPVLGKPFLQYQIEQLKKYNIIEIVLCVGYLANQIKNYFKDGAKFGVNIRYAEEERPLGTAGALKNSRDYLEDEAFLALNGDSYSEVDFLKFIQFHREKKGMGAILLTRVSRPEDYGLVKMDEDNRITGFFEKPGKTPSSSIINAGVYFLEPRVLNYIPEGRQISLEREIFPHLLEKKVPLFGYLTSDYFIDIGSPQKYAQIQKDMKEMIR
ncbi:nucleotidyltransferase [Candidatus Aerophobetes bacterium Ae_b3b]|nr:MAG: nucleotidyltransferase [Candidatus Aerophobetes bacterium Ae_b3b]